MSTISTNITLADRAHSWLDEQGVRYSQDGKKLIKGAEDLQNYILSSSF